MSESISERSALGPATLLIDGKHVHAEDGRTFNTFEPATGEILAEVALAGAADVEKAVAAARRAFDDGPWPRISAAERGRRLAAGIPPHTRAAGNPGAAWRVATAAKPWLTRETR